MSTFEKHIEGQATPTGERRVTVISPSRTPVPWRELWERRELLGFLVWRELKIRYKQTAIGALWALFQPLVAMAIFSVIFGRLVGVESGPVSYATFALTGLILWIFYANTLGQASNSLIDNERILSKVYFPRLMLPVAPVLAGLVDAAIGTVLVLAVTLVETNPFTPRLLLAPTAFALAATTSIGVGLVLSALNVHFRDVKYVVPFLLQVWMFASPVVYPASTIPDAWRPVYAINPVSTAIGILRWSVHGAEAPPWSAVAVSVGVAALVAIIGVHTFHRAEGTFADVV